MLKLNIGCGWECMDGWINADNTQKWQREQYPIQFMDATIPWDLKKKHLIISIVLIWLNIYLKKKVCLL